MNIREEIEKEHSKSKTMEVVAYIGKQQARFDELMVLFFGNEYRVTQRAAWVVRYAAEANPALIQSHLAPMVHNLRKEVHDAVKRNTLKILTMIDLPEDLLGELTDSCFGFLMNPQEAVAIRIFSMEILYQVTLREPDLADELRLVIEEHWEHGTAGFRSRGKRVLKGLTKLER